MIGFVLFTARLLAFVFQSSGLTETFSSFILNLPFGKYGTVFIICIMYLILGMFFDSLSMMLLTLNLGFDPIWFGVIIVIMMEMSLITPPVGVNVFVIKGVAKDVPMYTIFRGIWPFWIAMLVCLIILSIFPQIALFLPNAMSG